MGSKLLENYKFPEITNSEVLPKDMASDVNRLCGYCLRYYEVSRRIVRVNKKLHFETGKQLFEKRGHRWTLTSFAFESWEET